MLQYVIIAHDGTDAEAPGRRKETRPIHLEGARKMKEKNEFLFGGAILDQAQQMRGSVMVVQFETEEQFKEWYDNEPYISKGVWKDITVYPFRKAEI